VNRSWGVSQRSNKKRCFVSCKQTPSSANNFIPGYQMAFQTDNQGRRFLAKDTFQKNASVSDGKLNLH
jgi:hypothetical protein